MDDIISRQEAIDALEKMSANYGKIGRREWHPHIEECKSELRMLPSAQPEIIRCKDCKWKNKHNCTRAVEVFITDDNYCSWAERREE